MQSLKDLVPSLIEATEKKRLVWSKHEWGGFVTDLDAFRLRTWEWEDDASQEIKGISVCLLNGSTLMDEVVSSEFGPEHPMLKQLHSAARRSALNVESAIEKLQSALGKLTAPP